MSGFEVIGLALALWPVIGTLNDLYSSAKDGTTARWATTIKVQERIFKETVLKLLQGDEDLSEKDRAGLISGDKDFESLWKDKEFSIRLESRLDKEMCGYIKHEISEIAKLVTTLQKTLGDPKPEAAKKENFHFPKFRDVRRVLRKEEMRKNVDSLAFHNSTLRRLLKSCSNTAYADAKPKQTASAVQSQRTPAQAEWQKRVNTQFFNGFHEVLGKSFRCNCPAGHEANLSISDTLVMFQAEDLSTVMSNLRLRGRSATMESDITVYGDGDDTEDIMSELVRSTWSKARQGSLSTRSCEHPALLIQYSESRGVQNFTPIPDLCQWINTVRASSSSPPNSLSDMAAELQGVLGDDCKKFTVRAPRQHAPVTIVPMEDWLASCGTQRQRRRVRAELAMNLASTIHQFYPTAWIDKTWTWKNFSVVRDESASSLPSSSAAATQPRSPGQHNLVITQRFWSPDASRQQSLNNIKQPLLAQQQQSPSSRFWTTFPDLDPMLVRLGFALIELAFGKRLVDIRLEREKGIKEGKKRGTLDDGDDDEPDSDDDFSPSSSPRSLKDADLVDYFTAIDILNSNEIEDEIGVAYQRVVEACLRCRVLTDVGVQLLKSDTGNAQFERDLEQFVVEPLRRHHSSTWGPVMQIQTY